MTAGPTEAWVRRLSPQLGPDPRRVLARLFVPGQEMLADGESRAGGVIDRILALSDEEVAVTLEATLSGFAHRHRELERVAHGAEEPEHCGQGHGDKGPGNGDPQLRPRGGEHAEEPCDAAKEPERDPLDLHALPEGPEGMAQLVQHDRDEEHQCRGGSHGHVGPGG